MTSSSRLRLASKTCNIKRVAVDEEGQTDLPASHLTSVPCTPIMPRNAGLIDSGRTGDGGRAFVSQNEVMFFGEYDIKQGDVLVLDGVEYSISDVYRYRIDDPYFVCVIEDVRAKREADSTFIR